ncbi:MAG: hypothetical protein A2X17_06960 [Bacteroidetes bacterium GWF2_41_61]|nr:MAG: hypothetical protein A2X17_06960 [Bacteroidetes bacterium GWF2_41_61]OFY89511.1 MAG: hypothetical protein A2266_05060 [Bacteroidetes bacterium RIFOXYA12_FULL_40_10]HBG25359.1 hypothetical protein [Rikenellaceae bacterium]
MFSKPSSKVSLFAGIALCFLILSSTINAQINESYIAQFKERRVEISSIIPQSRVVVNIPSLESLKSNRETRIILYALPNGNTIEQTEGVLFENGEKRAREWRYDIQHIAAQVRFLRERDHRYNYIVVYLESTTKAWTSHASAHSNSPALYKSLLDSIRSYIANELPKIAPLTRQRIVVASHSGGGRYVFNLIKGMDSIPSYVEKFAFMDSNYGYETDLHADKLAKWIRVERSLGVISYVDTTVILDGKRVVSATGGTGYRSHLMANDLRERGVEMDFKRDTTFTGYKGGWVEIKIKENPTGKIYHTVLVERNGLIHMVLFGSRLERRGYSFWGTRCYSKYILNSKEQ